MASPRSLQLQQVRLLQQRIVADMSQLAWQGTLTSVSCRTGLLHALQQIVQGIEVSLSRQPPDAVLTTPALQIYAWLRFLQLPDHLEQHLQATQLVHQLLAAALAKPVASSHSQLPTVGFVHLAGLYRGWQQPRGSRLYLSEGFIAAEATVLQAIAQTFLWGKSQQTSRTIRDFSLQEPFRQVLLALETQVAPTDVSQGQVYDLGQVFGVVNQTYFGGQMEQPRLSWSQRRSRRQLGHYEPSRDRIVVSSILDQVQVPRSVVEFVMYHELLHKHHRETWVNQRLMVHTAQFRQQEAQFAEYEAVQSWLQQQ